MEETRNSAVTTRRGERVNLSAREKESGEGGKLTSDKNGDNSKKAASDPLVERGLLDLVLLVVTKSILDGTSDPSRLGLAESATVSETRDAATLVDGGVVRVDSSLGVQVLVCEKLEGDCGRGG